MKFCGQMKAKKKKGKNNDARIHKIQQKKIG